MSCQVFNGPLPKGVCAAGSDNPTFLIAGFKKCCGPAPVVQYYSNTTGCRVAVHIVQLCRMVQPALSSKTVLLEQ
ncbi:hypothetical protein CFAM422_003181 [Trichoderma lentiforme]|uniref:Uncharacterized protein n=1 Tax=Trichoderma lentiforme TaxID=1567552 RepID=A0A9P4XKG8_9HYPO|nr:hypothetical protein CFAM422_003181 [Trichoderma lentiforme]